MDILCLDISCDKSKGLAPERSLTTLHIAPAARESGRARREDCGDGEPAWGYSVSLNLNTNSQQRFSVFIQYLG